MGKIIVNKSKPSTSTSFIGSKWKIALSESESLALALQMDSKSHTRIQPSQPTKIGVVGTFVRKKYFEIHSRYFFPKMIYIEFIMMLMKRDTLKHPENA